VEPAARANERDRIFHFFAEGQRDAGRGNSGKRRCNCSEPGVRWKNTAARDEVRERAQQGVYWFIAGETRERLLRPWAFCVNDDCPAARTSMVERRKPGYNWAFMRSKPGETLQEVFD